MQRTCLLLSALLATVLVPAAAQARQDYPVAFVERPLTLPKLMLSPWLSVGHSRVTPRYSDPDHTVLSLGAALGLNDYFEIEAQALPLWLYPQVRYGQARFGATAGFAAGPVELGLNANVAVRSPDYDVGGNVWLHDPWTLSFGIPLVIHAGKKVRIETGFRTAIALPDRAEEVVSFFVPVGVYIQPVRVFFFGVDTGVGIGNLRRDSTYVPVSGTVGFTVPHRRRPLVDFTASVGFPSLVTLPNGVVVHGDVWTLGAAARFYVQL
ncbi:MAG: hypothetical protein QM765_51945 [Myxococcales bacterium]